MISNICFWQ